MAELDGGQVAAVLAADAELDVRAGALAFCNSEADQAAYAVLVQTSERIRLEDLLVEVGLQNAAHIIREKP